MGIEQGVRTKRLVPVGLGDRFGEPAVVRRTSYAKDPQGHRDGDAAGGELFHERVEPFPGRFV